jgi:formyltetrahydrofolate deformylase
MGLVCDITSALLDHNSNVISNHEFVDPPSGKFFMRTVFESEASGEILELEVKARLKSDASVSIVEPRKKKIFILATKEAHVLGDLLVRCRYDDMNAEIVGVLSNRDNLRDLVQSFDLPFHFISAMDCSREEHQTKVLNILKSSNFDFLVLAKYMRILTPSFVAHYPNRIINIHHSFLPAFIGANPYRQAHERGVKVIGATAHFVNDDLDEGPIIAQGVKSVDHQLDPKGLAQMGRDIEKTTLAKALELVCSERVFLAENRTVVF